MSKAEWNKTAAGSFSVICHCSAGCVSTGVDQKCCVCPVQGRDKMPQSPRCVFKTKTNLDCCNIIRTFEVRSELSIYLFPIAAHHHCSRGRAGAGGTGRLTTFNAAPHREENKQFWVRPLTQSVSPRLQAEGGAAGKNPRRRRESSRCSYLSTADHYFIEILKYVSTRWGLRSLLSHKWTVWLSETVRYLARLFKEKELVPFIVTENLLYSSRQVQVPFFSLAVGNK